MKKLNILFFVLGFCLFSTNLSANNTNCTRCKPGNNTATDNSSGQSKPDDTNTKTYRVPSSSTQANTQQQRNSRTRNKKSSSLKKGY